MTDQPFSEEEASAFSAKLDDGSQTLTDREQAVLRGLLAHAINGAPAEDDAEVTGFAFDAFLTIEGIVGGSTTGRLTTRDLS